MRAIQSGWSGDGAVRRVRLCWLLQTTANNFDGVGRQSKGRAIELVSKKTEERFDEISPVVCAIPFCVAEAKAFGMTWVHLFNGLRPVPTN